MDSEPEPADPARAGASAPFDLSGGHPALDLVNTLDHRFEEPGPRELLRGYAELLRFAQESRLISAERARQLHRSATPAAAARALRQARELREALAATLYAHLEGRAPLPGDVRILERHLHEAQRHRELRWERAGSAAEGAALSWQWGRFEKEPQLPVWMLADSAAAVMQSGTLGRVRACDADTCRWLFLDTSKNHTRRWCNMKVCGNRMKARRFQARQEAR
jgi:predicted RNA-binding Zn ribbon-like protein